MKNTNNKKTISLVERLSEIIETRKQIEVEERELKNQLKQVMIEADTTCMQAGEYLCLISTRTRTDLDKEKVQMLLGEEFDSVLKRSLYQIFEVKKV